MQDPPRRWTDESGQPNIGRHRTRALTNGLVIGMGISLVLAQAYFGVVLIVLGAAFEYWHRQRFKSGSL